MHPLIESPNKIDIAEIVLLDAHIDREVMMQKMERGELLIAREEGKITGFLRYGFFWDEIPFF